MPPVLLIETDGVALARLRSRRGMTQDELGEAAHCTGELISAIEVGRINAAAGTLRRIARALDVTVAYLTYNGDLSLPDRALTPAARRFALAAQQAREARRAAQKVA